MQVTGHLLNMLLPECEETCMYGILPSIFIGIGFAIIYPTMLGIIPVVVEEKVLGTAFGIATCSYNYPDFMSPLIGSAIHDNTLNIKEGYYWVSIMRGNKVYSNHSIGCVHRALALFFLSAYKLRT